MCTPSPSSHADADADEDEDDDGDDGDGEGGKKKGAHHGTEVRVIVLRAYAVISAVDCDMLC